MSEKIRVIAPSIDFSRFPREMEGKWVVVRRATQQPLGSGDTPEEALRDADYQRGDESGVVGRVPSPLSVFTD